MLRKIKHFTTLTLALLISIATSFSTAQANTDDIKVQVNQYCLYLSEAPCIEEGRILVPMRDIMEALKVTVEWDEVNRTIIAHKDAHKIILPIDEESAIVNGKKVIPEVPISIINGTTMVPIRFIAESIDQKIEWDAEARKIKIGDFSDECIEQKIIYYEDIGIFIEPGAIFYFGGYKDGKMTGWGSYYDTDGVLLYQGEWKNDSPYVKEFKEGIYTLNHSDNSKWLEGFWQDGLMHGSGTAYYKEGGLLYEGDYQNGLYHGIGKYYERDKTLIYHGGFVENYPNGIGNVFYPSGMIMYEGKFSDALFHGWGKYFFEDGTLEFEGEWNKGSRVR